MSQTQVKPRCDIKSHGRKAICLVIRLCRNGVTLQFWVMIFSARIGL